MAQQAGGTSAKYRQIAADLRARIERGEYPVGAQLPTKPELEKRYGVALGTIDNALGVLRDLGMAETRQGMGTFVLSQLAEESEPELVSRLVSDFEDVRQRLGKVEERLQALEGERGAGSP